MKSLLLALLVPLLSAVSLSASAQQGRYENGDPIIINQASELVPWCKSEAEAVYIGLGYTPFQWTASYHDYSNHLYVDGRLRVHGEDIEVKCTITRGARVQYINVAIADPVVSNGIRKANATP